MVEFQPGDVVTFKSGGPDMTVMSITKDVAVCVWFKSDNSDIASHNFPFFTITKKGE